MPSLSYTYSLLSGSKFYACSYSNSSVMRDLTVLQYRISEFDFLKQHSLKSSMLSDFNSISLLPLAVRYVSPDNTMFIIERPPCQIDVDFSANKSYDFRKSPKYLHQAKIWIPWTVSVITYNGSLSSFSSQYSFSIYFNDRPLSSFDDPLVPCFLPNSSSGNICMGADSTPVANMIKDKAPIVDIYNYLFNSYFSGWNCDIHNRLPYHEYFTNNNIIQRIQSSKTGPKNYDSLTYSRSVSKTYNQMLHLLSQLTMEEMLDYIGYCNEKNVEYNRYIRNLSQIIESYSSRFQTSNTYLSNRNPLYLIEDISSRFDDEAKCTSLARVNISHSDNNDYDLKSFYNNPYIIAKIYKTHQELSSMKYFEYNNNFSIDLTSEEVLPYSIPFDQEETNALSS